MDAEEVYIEELDSTDVPEAELALFQEVEVLMQDNAAPVHLNDGEQIQRFVCDGETRLPDFCTKVESDEELDELEEDEEELDTKDSKRNREECAGFASTSSKNATLARPTSTQSDVALKTKKPNTISGDSDDDSTMTGDGRSQRGGTRHRTTLNTALQCMMGEANLSFARGQIDIAEKICLEIIRQNPLAAEPFFTLAEIYETRDPEKYFNFLTIATHLNPHEPDHWIRITDILIADNKMEQARNFFTRAIKVLPQNYEIRLRKGRLLEQMGLVHYAMHTYLKMLPHIPAREAKLCLSIAQNVARHFHKHNKTVLALRTMQKAYDVCAKAFTLEDLNLYMELLLLQKSYGRVLQILNDHTNLEVKFTQAATIKDESSGDGEKQHLPIMVTHCVIPDDFVPEFRVKACIGLIHLDAQQHFAHIMNTMLTNMDTASESQLDLYIDVVEAFMHHNHYEHAYDLLRPITDATIEYGPQCPAFVWLRQAECQQQLKRIDEAILSYSQVVELAPLCYKARFTLSALYKQQGRHADAVRVLEQPNDEDGMNPRLLYERCLMLHELGDIDEFLDVGYTLLVRSSLMLRSREELLTIANGINSYNSDSIRSILQMRNVTEDTDQAMEVYNKLGNDCADLTVEEEYDLFGKLASVAHDNRRYSYAQRLCFGMLTTRRFIYFNNDLERIVVLACYFNDDCQLAFSYLREMITRQQQQQELHNSNALWNMFSLLVQKGHSLQYHRYVRRLLSREQCALEFRIHIANYHLHCSSYKNALNEYAAVYRDQKNPLAAFCIAVVFNQMALQKRVYRKTSAMSHAIAFAHKYGEWRSGVIGGDYAMCPAAQEIDYNLGRFYQQAGMLHLALFHYERALEAKSPLIDEHEDFLGLKQEIAFNMHLIYLANGNRQKARQCIQQYCVV